MTVKSQIVTPSLRAMMSGLIDYAGLFPPAKLPLDEAMTNFAQYRAESDQWMLSRFIIPASRLSEVTADMLATATLDAPFSFSILGRGGATLDDFLDNLQADIEAILAFQSAYSERVITDLFEVKLPLTMLTAQDSEGVQELLRQSADLLAQVGTVIPYYEVVLNDAWEDTVTFAVNNLAQFNSDSPATPNVGFKLRCGGVTPDAFPTVAQVAFAIATCRDANLSMKATAGLHHPIRHYNESVQTKMHGFLNVFGAGLLAKKFNLAIDVIESMIADENAENFIFNEGGFTWGAYQISADEIQSGRQALMTSYGSCSFDEPREDLQALNLF